VSLLLTFTRFLAHTGMAASFRVFIRRDDVGDYVGLGNLHTELIVDELLERWMEAEQLSLPKSRISLWRVPCDRRPQPGDEANAIRLDDPSASLVDVGVKSGTWLLAKIIAEQALPGAKSVARSCLCAMYELAAACS
jgi:hypothetical protein